MNYRKTILHVDDDPDVTLLISEYPRPLGYEVTSLNDATQTLRTLGKSHHRLIILDIEMPGACGLELLREIKQTFGDSQVIMLTGMVSIQTLMQSYRWGAEACVFKPLVDIAPLREAVESVFAKIDRWWIALDELRKQRRTANLRSRCPAQCSSPCAGTCVSGSRPPLAAASCERQDKQCSA
jgi:CheY-like chemotaxis protein